MQNNCILFSEAKISLIFFINKSYDTTTFINSKKLLYFLNNNKICLNRFNLKT